MNDLGDAALRPLQVRRRASQKTAASRSSSMSGVRKTAAVRPLSRNASQRQKRIEQITPPLTPSTSTEDLTPSAPSAGGFQFHDYLRAQYAFHPRYDVASATVTLPLNQGDIILVHSVHASGWADGTLLDSGMRGWLPTNYCEPYCPHDMQNLLCALTQLYEAVRDCSAEGLSAFCNQGYTRGMVAGVRVLLENTRCLSRDAHLVSPQTGVLGLRRYRKGMLGELAAFLRYAEDVERSLRGESTRGVLEGDCLHQLLLNASKIVLRAAKFYDIWVGEVGHIAHVTVHIPFQNTNPAETDIVPPTPPADGTDFEAKMDDAQATVEMDSSHASTPTQASAVSLAHPAETCEEPMADAPPVERQFPLRNESLSQNQSTESLSKSRNSISYRISWSDGSSAAANSALKRLTDTYEQLHEVLTHFEMMSARMLAPNDWLLATRETLHSGREMLAVIDAIWDRSQRHESFSKVRDVMYKELHDMVVEASYVFDESSTIAEEERMSPLSLQKVSDRATQCIRTAHECSAAARVILERIGDFELEADRASPVDMPQPMELCDKPEAAQVQVQVQAKEESEVEDAETLEPLDVPDFPLPGATTLSLPPLNTEFSSIGDFTAPTSASTVTTQGSRRLSLLSAPNTLTPRTPLSLLPTPTTPTLDCSSLPNAAPSEDVEGAATTPSTCSFTTSIRDSSRSVTTMESEPETSPESSFDDGCPPCDLTEEIEKTIQAKTYAHELVLGADGQVCGGSLRALVERLTTNECTPNATFVTTFFLTFRIFTTPEELATTLVDRFDYLLGDDQQAGPVRLRVYNVFKQWLESHWRVDTDKPALDVIVPFAETRLAKALPMAGQRLLELTNKAAAAQSPNVSRQTAAMGRSYVATQAPQPSTSSTPIFSKLDATNMVAWKHGGAPPKVTSLDALELARQLTLKASRVFCSILPEELLNREWTKASGSIAFNVRELTVMSNDMVNFIMETILRCEEPKKRAKTIRHWLVVAEHCLQMSSYYVAVQISAALTNSTLTRLRKTWSHITAKENVRLEKLHTVFDPQRNKHNYRSLLASTTGACVPFLGVHQTDLFHIDDHNRNIRTRPASEDAPCNGPEIINFEKHTKTAKVISELQRCQVLYQLEEISDMQVWIQDQLIKVRTNDQVGFMIKQQAHYMRSLELEPQRSHDPSHLPLPTVRLFRGASEKESEAR